MYFSKTRSALFFGSPQTEQEFQTRLKAFFRIFLALALFQGLATLLTGLNPVPAIAHCLLAWMGFRWRSRCATFFILLDGLFSLGSMGFNVYSGHSPLLLGLPIVVSIYALQFFRLTLLYHRQPRI